MNKNFIAAQCWHSSSNGEFRVRPVTVLVDLETGDPLIWAESPVLGHTYKCTERFAVELGEYKRVELYLTKDEAEITCANLNKSFFGEKK